MTLQVLLIISAQHHRQIFLPSPEPSPSTLQGMLKTTGLTEATLVF